MVMYPCPMGAPCTDCQRYLRNHRFGETVTCPLCQSHDVTRKGTTGKGAQQYFCGSCHSYFNDFTGTVFANQRLTLGEMFYIISRMDRQSVADITDDLDRTYKTVLQFVHKVRENPEPESVVTAIRTEPAIERLIDIESFV